jgi:eukaryotic-like serine/threonine-protein kinase
MTDHLLRSGGPEIAEGDFLGHYRLAESIGEGGMGRVYKAIDTKLQRTVAVKILRPELLRDREKVRRFQREAKTTSTLSHPAIVTVFDVGEAKREGESVDFIVMEYVEGESLRQKLRQRLPLNKRLELVARIADGIAVAHAAGVVHRDLKPDNIIMTPEGQPKIVDFGLAKLIQPEMASASADEEAKTMTLDASREGMVIGTVGYMSPEQVEGRGIDHRTDIFGLGCILYEAVSGQRAFASDSVVGTLHKILTEEPEPLRQRDPSIPAGLDHVVRRCLAKDRDERYQSAKEIAIELRTMMATTAADEIAARPVKWRRWALAAAAVVVVAAVAAWSGSFLTPGTDINHYRFTPFATDAAYEGFPAWSPDGRAIAYVRDVEGILQIFVRSLDSPTAAQITRAARDCREPFWHPRGDRIFFISQAGEGDALWSVGTGGGSPEVVLADVSTADISPDGRALVLLRQTSGHGSFRSSIWVSSPPGAEPVQYSRGELAKYNLALPGHVRFSADGSKIGLWSAYNPANPTAKSGPNVPTGFWILPYPDGEPHLVDLSADVESLTFRFSWMGDNRHVVFGGELPKAEGTHLWIMNTANGVIQPLTTGHASESDPAVAPDGKRIAFSSERGDYDLVSIDLDSGVLGSYASTTRLERSPASSPVRPEIAYVTNRSGRQEVWLRSEDGAWERPVASTKDFDGEPTLMIGNVAFSPDGQRVAYQRRSPHGYHVWVSSIAGGPPVRVVPGDGYQDNPTWSPDGDWMAFVVTMGDGFALHKARVGAGSPPVSIKDPIVYPSVPQWSPRGDWITVETPDGFGITSPDGTDTRILLEASVAAHTWLRDGAAIYTIQISDDLHLLLSKIDIETGAETQLADLGLSPPVIDPIAGLTLAPDGKKLLMGIRRLEGDLWLLEGFAPPRRFQKMSLIGR